MKQRDSVTSKASSLKARLNTRPSRANNETPTPMTGQPKQVQIKTPIVSNSPMQGQTSQFVMVSRFMQPDPGLVKHEEQQNLKEIIRKDDPDDRPKLDRVNQFNISRRLKPDGTGEDDNQIRQVYKEMQYQSLILEQQKRVEQYIAPMGRTDIYFDEERLQRLKRQAELLQLEEHNAASEKIFIRGYFESENQKVQSITSNYNISAFMNKPHQHQENSVNHLVSDRSSAMKSINFDGASARQSMDYIRSFKDSEQNLDESCQMFQMPIMEERLIIPGELDNSEPKVQLVRPSVMGQQMREELTFPEPTRDSLLLVRNKQRLSLLLTHNDEDLQDYNEAKINDVGKTIMEDPPIIQSYCYLQISSCDVYQRGVQIPEIKEQLTKWTAQTNGIRNNVAHLYQVKRDKLHKAEILVSYLNDEFQEAYKLRLESLSSFEIVQKDVAAFSIKSTRQEILDNTQWKKLLDTLDQLQSQMEANVQQINYNIGLTEQSIRETTKKEDDKSIQDQMRIVSDQTLQYIRTLINLVDQKYSVYVGHVEKCLALQNYLKFYFLQDEKNDDEHYSQERQFVQFLYQYPQMDGNLQAELRKYVQNVYKCLIKLFDDQTDDLRFLRRLVSNFDKNITQLQMLYEFSGITIVKFEIKVKQIASQLSSIKLPFLDHQVHNNSILSENVSKLQKLSARQTFLQPQLESMTFSPEQLELIVTYAGRKFLLGDYIGCRNSLIKNPKRFNWTLLYEKQMFFLQKIKEQIFQIMVRLFKIEKRLQRLFFQVDVLKDIYKFYATFPDKENGLTHVQDLRGQIRSHLTVTENQIILKTHIKDLKQLLKSLLAMKAEFSQFQPYPTKTGQRLGINDTLLLPTQLQRLREWISNEIDQCYHLVEILSESVKTSIEQSTAGEANVTSTINKSNKLQEKIKVIITVEPSPPVLLQVVNKKRGIKVEAKQQIPITLQNEQQTAIMLIYQKYLEDNYVGGQPQEEQTSLQLAKLSLADQCNAVLNEMSGLRESPTVSFEKKGEITESYRQLSALRQKYQIWEHIVATRFLMDVQMMSDVVKTLKPMKEHEDTQAMYQIGPLIKKLKEQQNFFEMNKKDRQCELFRKHVEDGIRFLTICQNNYAEYEVLVEKNKQVPNSVNIEEHMTVFQNEIQKFFKSKDCTLVPFKEEINQVVKVYKQKNTVQFKNKEKVTNLELMFQNIDPFVKECEVTLEAGGRQFMDIYRTDFQTQYDIERGKPYTNKYVSLDIFVDTFSISKEIAAQKVKATKEHEKLKNHKETMDLKDLPDQEYKLVENIRMLKEIMIFCEMYEKLTPAVFYAGVDILQLSSDMIFHLKVLVEQSKFETVLDAIKIFGGNISQRVKELMTVEKPFSQENDQRNKDPNAKPTPNQPTYQVLFRKGKVMEEVNLLTTRIGIQSIESMLLMEQLIRTFNEITNSFKKFSDQIDLQSADFFQNVNLWHKFFGGKEKDGKDASKKEHFEPILKEIEGKILKIPTFAAKVKEALTAVYQELYKQLYDYFSQFNPGFMNDLVQFGKKFHGDSQRVRNFDQFSKDLMSCLTINSENKDTVRNALRAFQEKNKNSEQPLQRMNQFIDAMRVIQSSLRDKPAEKAPPSKVKGKSVSVKEAQEPVHPPRPVLDPPQRILNKLLGVEDIESRMGGGHIDKWMDMLKKMNISLEDYLNDTTKGAVRDEKYYIQKIEETAANLADEDLKRLTQKFLELVHKDFDLSKVLSAQD